MDHMGSLPIVFGRLGLGGVPVICTTPVSKFGKMILYDFCLNKGMEGTQLSAGAVQQQFELDDIDLALSNVTTVKYSQTVHLPGVAETAGEGMFICKLLLPIALSRRVVAGHYHFCSYFTDHWLLERSFCVFHPERHVSEFFSLPTYFGPLFSILSLW